MLCYKQLTQGRVVKPEAWGGSCPCYICRTASSAVSRSALRDSHHLAPTQALRVSFEEAASRYHGALLIGAEAHSLEDAKQAQSAIPACPGHSRDQSESPKLSPAARPLRHPSFVAACCSRTLLTAAASISNMRGAQLQPQ